VGEQIEGRRRQHADEEEAGPGAAAGMKTAALPHQAEELEKHGMEPVRAIFWEQGLGKTWIFLAEMEELARHGKVNAAFILAPNNLHNNFVRYEIPPHLELPHTAFAYQTHRANTKKHGQAVDALLKAEFPILTMSYDALMTDAGRKVAKEFLQRRQCFYGADESNRFKTPGAQRTKRVVASGAYAQYKRILCGTPLTRSPFDAYTQFKFLDEHFWDNTPYGLRSFQAFKSFFGKWSKGWNGKTGREYDQLLEYSNLEILSNLVASISSRLLKENVLKDLPPKTYSYSGFELSREQMRLYKELETDFMTLMASGELITAPLAITRLLRLQQVACGYLPIEGKFVDIEKKNPRLEALLNIIEDLPSDHKFLCWARFVADIDRICAALGDRVTRWDGTLDSDQREANKARFKTDPKCQAIVATPDSMSEGHTLNEAQTEIFYSNSFNLNHRLQAEDRCHRIGQHNNVHIIDLVASGTVDLGVAECLKNKYDVISQIMDGRVRDWLTRPSDNGIL
jgi:hypothetical protein